MMFSMKTKPDKHTKRTKPCFREGPLENSGQNRTGN